MFWSAWKFFINNSVYHSRNLIKKLLINYSWDGSTEHWKLSYHKQTTWWPLTARFIASYRILHLEWMQLLKLELTLHVTQGHWQWHCAIWHKYLSQVAYSNDVSYLAFHTTHQILWCKWWLSKRKDYSVWNDVNVLPLQGIREGMTEEISSVS